MEAREGGDLAAGVHDVARCERADLGCGGDGRVERLEERSAVIGVVLPAVLAVERHAHGRRQGRAVVVADALQPGHEILGRRRRVPVLVDEPDAIRQLAVAEQQHHGAGPGLEPPWTVERASRRRADVSSDAHRTPSSLAAHATPARANRSIASGLTLPSGGHMPRAASAEHARVSIERARDLTVGVLGERERLLR